jgi:hypothetical protein
MLWCHHDYNFYIKTFTEDKLMIAFLASSVVTGTIMTKSVTTANKTKII